MYQHILVPLDGSPIGESVLPYVQTLAKSLESRISFLHVVDPEAQEAASDPEHGIFLEMLEESARSLAMDYLRELGDGLEQEGLSLDYIVRIGEAPATIAAVAGASEDTLIAMSTHGRTGLGRWLLGSVATKVLATSRCPLLLVRSKEMFARRGEAPLQNIVVPLDGSENAEGVLPHVIGLAQSLDLQVVLTRVINPVAFRIGVPIYRRLPGSNSRESELAATKYLKEKADQLHQAGVGRTSVVTLHGNPAEQIIELSHRTENNLVVMSSHGHSNIGDWAFGSVIERVVRHCDDPVLVVRATE